MTITLTPLFAKNTTYSSGPDVGTPTKVDPASLLNGFVAGTAIAPQHVNFWVNTLSSAARRHFLLAAGFTRSMAAGYADLDASCGACQMPDGRLLVERFDSSRHGTILTDWGGGQTAGAFTGTSTPITSVVTDAASNGSRIVIIGSGGNCNAYSSNNGSSWTTGGFLATNGPRTRLVWNANKSKWHATGPANGSVFSNSSTPTSPWSSEGSGVPAPDGLAVLSNGNLYVLGDNGSTTEPVFFVSADGGASFSADTGLSFTGALESGSLVGNGGASLYHVCHVSGGLAISRRTAGTGWALTSTIGGVASISAFDGRPRILMCQQTGLLAIVAPVNAGLNSAVWVSTDGADWMGPLLVSPQIDLDGWGIAGGRLIASTDELILASDGIGL